MSNQPPHAIEEKPMPDGVKVVPREPDEAMIEAGAVRFQRAHGDSCYPVSMEGERKRAALAVWQAMHDAAPSTPAMSEAAPPAVADVAEALDQVITAWAWAHNIEGATRNELMRLVRARLTTLAQQPPRGEIECPDCKLTNVRSPRCDYCGAALDQSSAAPVDRVSERIENAGYVRAFYELAAMMGIDPQPRSPRDVWESQMKPRLERALQQARPGGEVAK